MGAAGAHLAPRDVVAEVDPDRVVEVGEGGLRLAVDVVEPRLPAGVLAPVEGRLVLPQVLGQQDDARVVPRDVGRLLEVAVLGAGRHPAELVGRVGLVAVLVQPQAERRRGALQSVAALQFVEQALDLLQAAEVGIVPVRVGLARRVARAVRVVADAVGERGPEGAAPAGVDGLQLAVEAAEAAQELERAHVRVVALQVAPGRGERPDQDLGDRVRGVDRRVRGEDHRAVDVRRDRGAALLAAVGLRLHPHRQVGLVPEDVLVDPVPVPARGRRSEVRECGRARPVPRVAARRVARRPEGRRPVEHQDRLDPRARQPVHGRVDGPPPVLGIAGVRRLETGRRHRRLGARRDAGPRDLDPHDVDAERLPLLHGVVRGGAARQQDRVVGDPGLHHARAGRRRGAEGGREQHDEQCDAPDHKL